MKFGLYSIMDHVADEYGPVFEAKNDAVAQRQYKLLIRDRGLDPAEYALYWFGTFDRESGEFRIHDTRFISSDGIFEKEEVDG